MDNCFWMKCCEELFSEISSEILELVKHLQLAFEKRLIYIVNEDGSKVLFFHKFDEEQFYPAKDESIAINEAVCLIAVEASWCFFLKLEDIKNAISDYLKHSEEKFSWMETAEEKIHVFIGKTSKNDVAESSFAELT